MTCLCSLCSDAIVSQVLDELGLNLSDELSSKNNAAELSPSFLFVCLFYCTPNSDCLFVCLFQVFRAPGGACRWREGRKQSRRPPWQTPTPTWRSVWITSGETEAEALLLKALRSSGLCVGVLFGDETGRLSQQTGCSKAARLSDWVFHLTCHLCVLLRKNIYYKDQYRL